MKMTLLNGSINSVQWSIISFGLVQLIALGKALIDAYSRIKILEEKLETNSVGDSDLKEQLKDVKNTLSQHLKDKEEAKEKLRNLIFKELKRIEDKGDGNDKVIHRRADELAQAIVRVETKADLILRNLDHIL